MNNGKRELQKQINLLSALVSENPCRMPDDFFSAMAKSLRALVSRHSKQQMSMEEVALFFNTTPRTIRRWQQTRNFPSGRSFGHRELSFYADEIIEWKQNNML